MKKLYKIKDYTGTEIFVLAENLKIVKNRFDFPEINEIKFVDLTIKTLKK